MSRIRGASAGYATFQDIIRLIHVCTKVEEIAELVVYKINQAFDAQGAWLQLYESRTGQRYADVGYGLGETYQPSVPPADTQGVLELCRRKEAVVISDVNQAPPGLLTEQAVAAGIRMLLVTPLGLREELVGLICLGFAEKLEFAPEELDFLSAVAQQCTCAIDKALLIERQQKQFDQLAYQTERLTALGRMAAGVAHELNNPLSSILLYSSNMKKKVPPEGFLHEGLDIIMQETKRCKGIIQDLQEFSRSKEPKKTVGNINQILEKVLTLLENEFRKQHIRVHRQMAPALPDMWIDIGQMQQVFANLLINAVEAVGTKGEISITTRVDAGRTGVEIEIADTGSGIPPEYVPRIFEPFFSTKAKGTGLGLAVTYGFIQNHQGDIQVDSAPGKGTRFVIHLPLNTNHIASERSGL